MNTSGEGSGVAWQRIAIAGAGSVGARKRLLEPLRAVFLVLAALAAARGLDAPAS